MLGQNVSDLKDNKKTVGSTAMISILLLYYCKVKIFDIRCFYSGFSKL